ncbi:MAG: hypothetical protein PT118_25265 [Aphanizomenon gracile PMC644.10]|nr:hypothetical protein [Aphanizomenon gracile PMC644.10]
MDKLGDRTSHIQQRSLSHIPKSDRPSTPQKAIASPQPKKRSHSHTPNSDRSPTSPKSDRTPTSPNSDRPSTTQKAIANRLQQYK